VPRDRWIFPLVGLESSAAVPLVNRRHLHRWPAMGLLGRMAADHLGRRVADCDHVELYSCFPAAVRVQQRELDLPADGTPTITGGMTFAGGPFNSFVLQSTAAMARRLRDQPGLGLVTTVSGLLTKPGLAVWSSAPGPRPPLVADARAEAAALTEIVDATADHEGPGTVAAATVTYDGLRPDQVIAIVDVEGDRRTIARSRDRDLIDRTVVEGLVGASVRTAGSALL
jgi:acetyl-CoA C-acetyltransferase